MMDPGRSGLRKSQKMLRSKTKYYSLHKQFAVALLILTSIVSIALAIYSYVDYKSQLKLRLNSFSSYIHNDLKFISYYQDLDAAIELSNKIKPINEILNLNFKYNDQIVYRLDRKNINYSIGHNESFSLEYTKNNTFVYVRKVSFSKDQRGLLIIEHDSNELKKLLLSNLIVQLLIYFIVAIIAIVFLHFSVTSGLIELHNVINDTGSGKIQVIRKQSWIKELHELTDKLESVDKEISNQNREIKKYIDLLNKASIICETDPNGFITYYNNNFENLFTAGINLNGNPHFKDLLCQANKKQWKEIEESLNRGEEWRGEINISSADDESIWLFTVFIPVFDNLENINAFSSISFDITNDKTNQNIIERQEKLASIGTLAAGIAHEVNNPLAIIKSNMTIIKKKRERFTDDNLSDIEIKCYQNMEVGITRIQNIVTGLGNFSRIEDDVSGFELRDLVSETVDLVSEIYRTRNINLRLHNVNDVVVFGSRGKIQQVLINLLKNAKDELESFQTDKRKEIEVGTRINGKYVETYVIDNGRGISPELQTKIFEPFFTTKAINSGTGIGLSICHKIIEEHSGKLELYSEVTKGAKFSILLPISDPQSIERT